MNHEHTQTLLRFTGDWPVLPVLGLAAALAGIMFLFYRRELRFHQGPSRWVPALLRALAVFILVLALAGPVLRHVTELRRLGRVVLAVDASASMSHADGESPRAGSASRATAPRFLRAERSLFHPTDPLLRRLAEKHDVELFLLRGAKAERIWWRRDGGADSSGDLPSRFPGAADANLTNLDEPLREAVGSAAAGTALVVLTDGQHNAGGSPEDLAAGMRENSVPIFTIGYGSETPPADLALVQVLAPEAVFAGDRAEGVLVLQDTLPGDLPAVASISYQNKVLWRQPFTTNGRGERQIEFAFPVKDLADAGSVRQTLRLLSIRAELTGPDASRDRITDNNTRVLALHLLTRKRRVLILDGRPRWETRYLQNHFDRDERWQVSSAFDDGGTGASGAIQRAFPKRAEELLTFDLVVLGDLRPAALTDAQHQMLADFAAKRGGGIVLVDGRRRHLREWSSTKAAPLLPVSWNEFAAPGAPQSFSLTTDGRNLEALRLSDSASANPQFWTRLPRINWCATAKPLPGTTILANVASEGARELPAIAWRRLGAGSVLWLGTDELWRWRYEVADQHHQRFWMQIAAWIAAPPFLVENDRVGLGTDRLRYQEGDTAELRVRLRDKDGGIVSDAKARALVLRNGMEIASLELEPDPAHGGVFRATTGALPSGDYHITVSEDGAPAQDVRLAFRVESRANQEWGQLQLNRALLEGMAARSGGRFLREGDLTQLPDLLQTLDQRETRVRETLLWSSWWWFGAVVALLTAEWLLRKRWRLV